MLAVYASRAPSTLCQRRLNFVVTKNLRPVDAGFTDGLPDAVLVPVVLRGIDEPIAGLDRRPDLGRGLGAAQRRGADSQRGDRRAVPERDGRSSSRVGHKTSQYGASSGRQGPPSVGQFDTETVGEQGLQRPRALARVRPGLVQLAPFDWLVARAEYCE